MTKGRYSDKVLVRSKVTHRCAVRALEKIQEALAPRYGTIAWSCWNHDYSYDSAIYNMVEEVRRNKHYAEKYFELRKMLKSVVD